jgi:hypothetical protein
VSVSQDSLQQYLVPEVSKFDRSAVPVGPVDRPEMSIAVADTSHKSSVKSASDAGRPWLPRFRQTKGLVDLIVPRCPGKTYMVS